MVGCRGPAGAHWHEMEVRRGGVCLAFARRRGGRACGQKCVNNGQPIGLLTKSGALYMLMPEEHDPRRDGGVDAKASASDHMGHIVTVNGTAAKVGGYSAIYVQGLTK